MSSLAARKRARLGERTLRPVHPSAAIEQAYAKRLRKLVDEMGKSVDHWLRAGWRRGEDITPVDLLAQDEPIVFVLSRTMAQLRKQWERRFDQEAKAAADSFVRSTTSRVVNALRNSLRSTLRDDEKRVSVPYTITPAMRQVMAATVQANVSLIKSIPAKYLEQVEGIVMRGVQNGRDLGAVSRDLQHQLGVTKRRAALIARDQNNKATSALVNVRWQELGIKEAIWIHSHGGKEPRPTHLRAGRERQRYETSEGWYDPAVKKHIHPGELINCRCVGRPIVPGFS